MCLQQPSSKPKLCKITNLAQFGRWWVGVVNSKFERSGLSGFAATLVFLPSATASATPSTSESAAPGTSESAAPGAGESALSGTAPTKALHTFTLDSGASCSFFRDSTTLTPLSWPVAVSVADPSGGPDLAHSSTVLPCPAALSGLLSGLLLPSFSMNLVSGADLQNLWVDQFTPGGQHVTHCTCSRMGRHLATFTRRPGSSLYTLTTASPPVIASPPVTASSQVAASGQVFAATSRSSPASAPCSCRPLSHETLLWHHRLGHPSLPRLRGMASRTLGHERFFLLAIDNYSRYTTVFPLCRKGEVTEVLIHWIRGACCQLSERFGSDLPVLRLHSDRGAFVRDTSADKLFSRAVPCVFLGSPPHAPGWQFYHPTSRRVLSSQDVTIDESVSYYRVSQVDPVEPVEVVVDSGAARGAGPAGAGPGGAVRGVAESEGAEPGGPPGVPSRQEPLSPQQLREWYARRYSRAAGGASRAGAAGGAAGARAARAAGPGGTGAVGGPIG
ncbi:unnamed protein product, partial [Closterium sp. NIES-53]